MVLRSKKREEAIQLITIDPYVCGKLLTTHRRGKDVDVEALRGRFPLQRAPTKAPRWDLTNTEGYRGGNCVSLAPWMFSGYVGLYRRKKYVGGRPRGPRDRGTPYRGRPPISWRPQLLLDLHSKSPGSRSFQKSRSRRFHSLWTSFDILFLQNSEIGKKILSWASG